MQHKPVAEIISLLRRNDLPELHLNLLGILLRFLLVFLIFDIWGLLFVIVFTLAGFLMEMGIFFADFGGLAFLRRAAEKQAKQKQQG